MIEFSLDWYLGRKLAHIVKQYSVIAVICFWFPIARYILPEKSKQGLFLQESLFIGLEKSIILTSLALLNRCYLYAALVSK